MRISDWSSDVCSSDLPWARPSTGKTGAAYFTIKNNGADDKLTGVTADVSAKVQLHDMEMDGNIMRMRKLDALPLPAGKTVNVPPGGHLGSASCRTRVCHHV